MAFVIKQIFQYGPLIFAFGFLAPLIAQTMALVELDAPFGMSQLQFALLAAGIMGIAVQVRGRWI